MTSKLAGTPDGLDFGKDGKLYAALSTGKVVAIDPQTGLFTQFGTVPRARLTGLSIGGDGTVYATDEVGGAVYAFAPSAPTNIAPKPISGQKILSSLNGKPLQWTNDVAVTPDGTLFVTTSSQRRNLDEFYQEVLEHSGSGLLIRLNLEDQTTKSLQSALEMTNGVALSHDGNAVLVAESSAYRVSRFGFNGGKEGEVASNLPGFPGNIRRSDKSGRYWLTLLSPRNGLVDRLAGNPMARRLLVWLPESVRPKPTPFHCLIRLTETSTGMLVQSFRIQGPKDMPSLSTAIERDGRLYITPAGLGGVERGDLYLIDDTKGIDQ
ncbi:SMP-30/gluconolactonase/LRE family protein [Novosphingobium sp. PASSN1]|uniref:SMP-30/gluconolactonase/LRE family protein n=1 Tax=Novosphingobium sp. PASSN1 TaxID=2015561 RepID=UPI002601530A|nr:SMP-30/gluconolactonase/LRE family protein [Novosphingobium sp. PASSN1]